MPAAKTKVEEYSPVEELVAAETAYVRTYREISTRIAKESRAAYTPARLAGQATKAAATKALASAGADFKRRMAAAFPLRTRDALISEQLPIAARASERMFLSGMSTATGRPISELRALDKAVADYEDVEPEDFEGFDEPIEDIVVGASVRAGLHADHGKAEAKFRKSNRTLMVDLWDKHERQLRSDLRDEIAADLGAAALILLLDRRLAERDAVTTRRGDAIAMNETQRLASEENAGMLGAGGVRKYIWKSQGDNRVRDLHVELDGTEHDVDGPGPDEGMHPGEPWLCRCFMVPTPFTPILRFYSGAHAEIYKAIQGRRLLSAGFPGDDE